MLDNDPAKWPLVKTIGPLCQKTYLWSCAPGEDSDQPAHSRSLIWIITGRIFDSQGCKVSSCGQRRHWSDCAHAQADLSLRCVHLSERYVFSCCGIFSRHRMQKNKQTNKKTKNKNTHTHTIKNKKKQKKQQQQKTNKQETTRRKKQQQKTPPPKQQQQKNNNNKNNKQ